MLYHNDIVEWGVEKNRKEKDMQSHMKKRALKLLVHFSHSVETPETQNKK